MVHVHAWHGYPLVLVKNVTVLNFLLKALRYTNMGFWRIPGCFSWCSNNFSSEGLQNINLHSAVSDELISHGRDKGTLFLGSSSQAS